MVSELSKIRTVVICVGAFVFAYLMSPLIMAYLDTTILGEYLPNPDRWNEFDRFLVWTGLK